VNLGLGSRASQPNVKPQTKRAPGQPVLDEEAFQQLLSAAHIMQEHNARLKKQADSQDAAKPRTVNSVSASPPIVPPATPASPKSFQDASCRECGQAVATDETFCGNCGTPTEAANSRSALQKNWASLWKMHHPADSLAEETAKNSSNGHASTAAHTTDENAPEEIDLFPSELEEIVARYAEPGEDERTARKNKSVAFASPAHESEGAEIAELDEIEHENAETGLITTGHHAMVEAEETVAEVEKVSPWGSAAKTRAWFDAIKASQPGGSWLRELWVTHGGNIAIGLSCLVLLVVIAQWFVRPSAKASNSSPQVSQQRQLSPFEELLVTLGLAEVPPAPQVYHGNPDTKVWADTRTALYYCPGAELYGKTQNGKYVSQSDAQRDQYEPATRKACD
jgi:hypothetical protein